MKPARQKPVPTGPSVHTRAVLTWIAIFPMVALGMSILAWLAPPWHPILRSLVLTLVVVPLTVYFTVPGLLKLHAKLPTRAARRESSNAEVEEELETQGIG
ncbi:hypothetical protein [Glutamicibacter sp. JC586]|uniref:hypothetical protein n=1 Tax=Glutamicibacter sp. JC586 TaxID=2590552 RepID=UPI00135CB914|nr:hypothetical protein [Glutamicibacter sp. JC586]